MPSDKKILTFLRRVSGIATLASFACLVVSLSALIAGLGEIEFVFEFTSYSLVTLIISSITFGYVESQYEVYSHEE